MIKEKSPKNSAKHAFFYLTSFFALGFLAVGVGNLFFEIIEYFFPLGTETGIHYASFQESTVKFGIASIVVAAPVFYFFTRHIVRSFSEKDLDKDTGVRRWLTYLILFITIATVIGDLVAALYSFLDGELTIRFCLKVLTILGIAGGIFLYYFSDIKNDSVATRARKQQLWSLVFFGIILVPFLWSFFLIENPKEARLRKIDNEIESALSQIRSSILSYTENENELPNNLDLLLPPDYSMPSKAIREEARITYKILSARNYELCAFFQSDNRSEIGSQPEYEYMEIWPHPAGEHCFSLQAAKEKIIPVSPPVY